METKKIELKLFVEALALVFILEGIMHLFLLMGAGEAFLLLGGTRVLETVTLILLFYFHTNDLAILGLNRSMFGSGLKKGLIWSSGFGVLAAVLFSGLYLADINPFELIRMRLPEKMPELLIFFLIGGVIGPVAEEIFFRGVLYGFFRRWGIVTALFLSTFLFVLPHIQLKHLPISLAVIQAFPQAVGGILFALAYELEKNLYTPMVIHILGNLVIFSLSFL